MYSISTNAEFLRFPKLSFIAKLRMGLSVLLGSRIKDWRRLEKIRAVDWLRRTCGKEAYEVFWKPLLLAKLGENYDRVSAVFIWSYIKRLHSARDSTAGREALGHVAGGYRTVLEKLEETIEERGGKILLNSPVSAVENGTGNKIKLVANGTVHEFDKLICTSPVSVVKQIVKPELLAGCSATNGSVDYLGA